MEHQKEDEIAEDEEAYFSPYFSKVSTVNPLYVPPYNKTINRRSSEGGVSWKSQPTRLIPKERCSPSTGWRYTQRAGNEPVNRQPESLNRLGSRPQFRMKPYVLSDYDRFQEHDADGWSVRRQMDESENDSLTWDDHQFHTRPLNA